MRDNPVFIMPDWDAPENIMAASTTRRGGVSSAPWQELNLAGHVGDNINDVVANRRLVRDVLKLPAEPCWLQQVHGRDVVDAESVVSTPCADAAYTDQPAVVCAVLTADCLPILIANRQGSEVAAVHAGWKGLQAGVIESTAGHFRASPQDLLAWLGPAIGPDTYEVGDDVRDGFVGKDPGFSMAFRPRDDRWLCDVYAIARRILVKIGVSHIHGGDYCTYTDSRRFYSYRRDGVTGRMASLIWMDMPDSA